MPRLLKSIYLISFLLFFCSAFVFAEDITITTYYPSPYGSYNSLQTDKLGVGDNNGDGSLTSADVPATSGDVWIKGNVGIGTTNPGTKLSVRVIGNGANAVLRLSSILSNWTAGYGPRLLFYGGTDDRPFGEIGSFLQNTGTGANAYMTFSTRESETVAERVRITSSGKVGIGTASPQQPLSVAGAARIDQTGSNTGTVDNSLTFGNVSGEGIGSKRNAGGNQYGLDFYTNSTARMSITTGGNVGIGTNNPTQKLTVAGNVRISGTYACNQAVDIAENMAWTDKSQRAPEAGDVVVIDLEKDENITLTNEPYNSSVAGVISTQPGLILGASLKGGAVALVGRVPTKVTTKNGPIHRGDLLVTSSQPGYAMRGDSRKIKPGTVVGKALGELIKGEGIIEVLVNL